MAGKLILVSGFSGAGKTTLIRATLGKIPNLEYLHSFTTRPKRPDETDDAEYTFVDDGTYERYRLASSSWDETIFQGFKYGTDITKVRELLQAGTNLILAIVPSKAILEQMTKLYSAKPLTIWVDTSREVSQSRIADDSIRSTRYEDGGARDCFMNFFAPCGQLNEDCRLFVGFVSRLLLSSQNS